MHFSDNETSIWKKKCHTLHCILWLFRIFVAYINNYNLKKMCGYPQFSFWIPIALATRKICFPRIVINCAKNTLVLVGIILDLQVVIR